MAIDPRWIQTGLDFFKSMFKEMKDKKQNDAAMRVLEAQQIFLDLRDELAKQSDRIRELERENEQLRTERAVSPTLSSSWYWVLKTGAWDGPFCTRCFDAKKLLIRARPGSFPSRIAKRGADGQVSVIGTRKVHFCPECNGRIAGDPTPPQEQPR